MSVEDEEEGGMKGDDEAKQALHLPKKGKTHMCNKKGDAHACVRSRVSRPFILYLQRAMRPQVSDGSKCETYKSVIRR